MPTVMSQELVEAYAHCVRPLCPGNQQELVQAVREELGTTYAEQGGDLPFVEKSTIRLRFADEIDDHPSQDAVCAHCGGKRDLTEQPRVQYANESGFDPNGLIGIKYAEDGTEKPESEWGQDRDALKDELRAELLAELRAEMQKGDGS